MTATPQCVIGVWIRNRPLELQRANTYVRHRPPMLSAVLYVLQAAWLALGRSARMQCTALPAATPHATAMLTDPCWRSLQMATPLVALLIYVLCRRPVPRRTGWVWLYSSNDCSANAAYLYFGL